MAPPLLLFAGVVVVASAAGARGQGPPVPVPPPDLAEYARAPDPAYQWTLRGKTDTPAGTVYDLALTSQVWHGLRWTHGLQVVVPAARPVADTVVLWNQGGGPSPATALLGVLLAGKVKAPVAFLYDIPNQPLLGGKREDALIAETFVRFLDTGDPSWPLLFPMTKSVVAAMDAVQELGAKEWGHKPAHFVITGASKRGWTAWLAAATGDPRVKAIAPLVIDMLNFPAQMRNQVRAFGKPSEMIHDYTDRKLVPIPDTPTAKKLWRLVDPFQYRANLKLPKMIINGANDPYWPLEALNSYWDELPGEKHVLYVPNAGHGLTEDRGGGAKDRDRAVNTLAAFCRSQVTGKPLPALAWKHTEGDGRVVLELTTDRTVKHVRRWVADAPTRDFRKATWQAEGPGPGADGFLIPRPAAGFRAVFAEAEYDVDGLSFTLSSQVRVLEPRK